MGIFISGFGLLITHGLELLWIWGLKTEKLKKFRGLPLPAAPVFIAFPRQTRLQNLMVENITQACGTWSSPEKDSVSHTSVS